MTDPATDLRMLHGASAEIGAEGRRLEVALDGEVMRMRAPLHYRIRPASLRVYVEAPLTPTTNADDRAHFGPSLWKP